MYITELGNQPISHIVDVHTGLSVHKLVSSERMCHFFLDIRERKEAKYVSKDDVFEGTTNKYVLLASLSAGEICSLYVWSTTSF